ncbi:hypothetical protein, partial [Mesorhizobium sp. M1399]|uniref:hypothetical protein n=1 Tax=Mesorhizobium sp. M1399 TaxID=2957096 RepID=UPI00333806AB
AQGFKQILSGLLIMVFETLGELAQDRDAHGDVEPVEHMFACRRDHLGKRADFFSSVDDESDVSYAGIWVTGLIKRRSVASFR